MDSEFTTDDISVRFTMPMEDFLDLVKERDGLREALADLVAVQNGPPLVTYTEEWSAAMDKAYAALKEGE